MFVFKKYNIIIKVKGIEDVKMVFKNELAHDDTYVKEYNDYKITSSYTVYETYIAISRDKDGNELKNKDGSPRYHTVDEKDVIALDSDKLVKEIREGFYKDVYEVNGDYVEKVDRDNKRIYFVVDKEKVKTLAKDTKVIAKNGTYRVMNEMGYVLVDDFDIEHPKVIAVRKFKTDDHKKEAEDIVRAKTRRYKEDVIEEK